MSKVVKAELELEPPILACGHCRFGSAVQGEWSVEDGRLVFRADADPQPRRGPDLNHCCESSVVAEFTKITSWQGLVIEGDQLEELRKTAEEAYGKDGTD